MMLVMLVVLEKHVILVIAVLPVARHVFDAPLLHTTHTSVVKLRLQTQ